MKYLKRIEMEHNGKIIGFRTWCIEAYDDNDQLILRLDKKESINYIKYVKFLIKLRSLGWDLTLEQRKKFKSEPFINPKYIKFVREKHLIKIANLCGYDKKFVKNINKKNKEEKEKFAYDIGLEYDELETIIKKINTKFF